MLTVLAVTVTAAAAVLTGPVDAGAASTTRVQVAAAGISLAVPAGWEQIVMTPERAQGLVAANPGQSLTTRDLLAVSLVARDDQDADGVPERWLTVKVVPRGRGLPPLGVARRGATREGFFAVTARHVEVGGKRAVEIRARYGLASAGVTRPVVQVAEYLFVHRAQAVKVGLFTLLEPDPRFASLARSVARSIRLER